MCGITGYLYVDGALHATEARPCASRARLDRRGPDDGEPWRADKVGVGHQRLSILDLSSRGKGR